MEDLDALKSDPGVIRLYSRYVKGLKRSGDKYVGLCPLHGEKSPSFTVFADMRFNCFGCQATGNIFQFLEKVGEYGFKQAVEIVKKELGTWSETKEKVESVFKPVAEPKTYKTIPLAQWEKLEDRLTNSSAALDWLNKERGIGPGAAQRLRLGFVQNIGNLAGEAGADIADKGWIAFPSIEGDQIISVKYRSIVRKKPGGFARQPGMATAMFNTETIDPFEPVYVTEGEFDACVLEAAGLHAVSVPSAGTKLTPEMKDKLMQASQVILAGDTDSSGSGYMSKLWKELAERTYLLTWPEKCKDANQTFLEYSKRGPQHFRTTVEELTAKAKSQPMPSVYSLQEAMVNGDEGTLYDRPDRLRFPWKPVDDMLIIVPGHIFGMGSSNTGMGKTMWTVQASLFNARKYHRTVLNFQAEMDPSEIGDLVAAQVLRIDRNFMTREDRRKAAAILTDEGVNYYIGRDPNLSKLSEVLDLLEAAIRRLSPDIVILDHFHHFSSGTSQDVQTEAAAMTRIKSMADTYKVIFVNVGQPRKATQQGRGKKIYLDDFKGAGAWKDASNSVIAIHRDLNKIEEDSVAKKGPYEDKTLVQVLKGRSLGRGASSCFLTCFGEFACFESLESNYEEVPNEIN